MPSDGDSESLVDIAWRHYRGGAFAARRMQSQLKREVAGAIALGTAAAFLPSMALVVDSDAVRTVLPILGAGSAALGFFVALRAINLSGRSDWLLARAVAEALKSECFRFKARAGEYADRDAALLFQKQIASMMAGHQGTRIIPEARRRAGESLPQPPDDMDLHWYCENRLRHEVDRLFYRSKQHASTLRRGKLAVLIACLAIIALSITSIASKNALSVAFIGTATTMAVGVAVDAFVGSRIYLGPIYSQLAYQLQQLLKSADVTGANLADLVLAGEELLLAEHSVWLTHIQRRRSGNGLVAKTARRRRR